MSKKENEEKAVWRAYLYGPKYAQFIFEFLAKDEAKAQRKARQIARSCGLWVDELHKMPQKTEAKGWIGKEPKTLELD